MMLADALWLVDAVAQFERFFSEIRDGAVGAIDTDSGLPYVTIASSGKTQDEGEAAAEWLVSAENYWLTQGRPKLLIWRLRPETTWSSHKVFSRVYSRMLVRPPLL